ncbi:MAG: hypothetical protein J5367_08520, partial [Lachnospiraceae bacterium]|nr:hypothetical protein [Lachnospiraceae bacterium]
MISKNFNKFKSDDSGSTLVTVIVAIAFVTILTSIILGTTLVNVRMKGIDKRTRDDFYYAEKALNDIYTGIGMELAQTAGDDYEAAFLMVGGTDVNDEGDTVDYNFAEEAEKEFRNRFLKDANTFLTSLTATELQKYITSRGHVDKVGAVEYQKKDGGTPSNWAETSRVVLKNVQISDTDTSGYQAVVTTDIVVTVPTVDFLGTNADVSDYGLIANQGLYINGDTEINGNVYAGVHMITTSGYGENTTDLDYPFYESTDKNSRDRIFGGINIKDGTAQFTGNYIVSKGDINLGGTSPHLKVYTPAAGGDANLANLWYTSLRTNSKASLPTPSPSDPFADPTVYINANVFALNDLILNAQYSTVKIKGNYYGYNDKTVTGIDAADLIGRKTGRDDGESSAIIVNGSNAYLDMKDINNFVLMGKAYIDFTSDDYTNPTGTVNQVVPTAESVALKTNQQLYLVPNDFLNEPNPSTESATFTISIPSTDLQNWFGYPYLDSASIHSPYTVKLTDGTYIYYDYLMFNTDKTWRPEWTSPGVPERNADGTYKYTEVDESVAALGTGGSISSKSKFFLDIMTSKEAYDYAYDHRSTETPPSGVNFMAMSKDEYIDFKEESKVQPSAYRLYERVNLSMGYEYFDLGECVVGDGATDAHYYAKNAVVNYEKNPATHKIQSNVLN